MRPEFYNLDHAVSRVQDSVVRLGEEPIYISEVQHGARDTQFRIFYQLLGDRASLTAYIPSRLINWLPVPLGFINYEGECLAAMRLPIRRYKIGLDRNNLQVHSVRGGGSIAFSTATLLKSNTLAKTIKGDFPSYAEAQKKVAGTWSNHAFSRVFAVTKTGELIHRDLGVVGEAGSTPKLSNDFKYLEELLQENMR